MSHFENELFNSKILIVDDEPQNVLVLEGFLGFGEYVNVHSTTDPREVVSLCEDHSFDIILLDIQMPHMTGIQVMEALAEPLKDDFVPILVLTAQTDDETRRDALVAGANDFLTKPFHSWEVLLRIKNMLKVRALYKFIRTRAETSEEKNWQLIQTILGA